MRLTRSRRSKPKTKGWPTKRREVVQRGSEGGKAARGLHAPETRRCCGGAWLRCWSRDLQGWVMLLEAHQTLVLPENLTAAASGQRRQMETVRTGSYPL